MKCRRIIGRARIDERLGADSVTGVLKPVVTRIGLPREEVQATSGHSLRVGATQDLLALNEGFPDIMHTGQWKDARMVEHYGRHLLAGRSAMARAEQAKPASNGWSNPSNRAWNQLHNGTWKGVKMW